LLAAYAFVTDSAGAESRFNWRQFFSALPPREKSGSKATRDGGALAGILPESIFMAPVSFILHHESQLLPPPPRVIQEH
jgi:hypothetical protein